MLLIAVIPLIAGTFWGKNRNKLIVAAILSVPVVLYLALGTPDGLGWLVESIQEYVAFMALLGALFVITGGIYLRGELAGTPIVNTGFLAFGALIANLIGTTGASLLLIRPLLRANEKRQRRVHMVVFFIFIVSNGAGLLTPLGDPPLFLGFLRGVPFFWALRLFGPWALVIGTLAGAVLRRRSRGAAARGARASRGAPRTGDPARRRAVASRRRTELRLAARRDRRGLRLGGPRGRVRPQFARPGAVPGRSACWRWPRFLTS